MDVNNLKAKIEAATAKVEKGKGTIARHEKALEKKKEKLIPFGVDFDNVKASKWDENGKGTNIYWDVCDYESKLRDIEGAKKKLKEAQTILQNWQDKLKKELDKEMFVLNNAPQIIINFLDKWKADNKEFALNSYPEYVIKKKEYKESKKTIEEELEEANPKLATWSHQFSQLVRETMKERSIFPIHTSYPPIVQNQDNFYNDVERAAYVEKILEEEKKVKLQDLVQRVTEITGKITDATGLYVSSKGNLDGYIIGERGKALVQTIGAGGYNIQCFHFRTLINEA